MARCTSTIDLQPEFHSHRMATNPAVLVLAALHQRLLSAILILFYYQTNVTGDSDACLDNGYTAND